jgi:osmotically inducible lipoprotein OsmB
MGKILAIAALGLMLAGCETARQDRQLTGGLIGAGAGGLIGGLATNSVGGALVGGVVGGAAGAIIADETRPRGGRCYRRTASGRLVRARC